MILDYGFGTMTATTIYPFCFLFIYLFISKSGIKHLIHHNTQSIMTAQELLGINLFLLPCET